MSEVEFAERMAKIRARFSLKLIAGVEETAQLLPKLAGGSRDAAEATATIYLRFHEMCGIGPTIGFEATGRAAKPLDTVLGTAWRAGRGLTDDEMAKVREGLEHVRVAMLAETQSRELAS
jgi:hypothetical protein